MTDKDIYKEAAQLGLRFLPPGDIGGNLTVEQLFKLKLTQLNEMAKSVSRELKEQDEEDFIDSSKTSRLVLTLQLQKDILIDVIDTLKAKQEANKNAKRLSEQKQKLMELIKEKEKDELSNLSIEELQKQLSHLLSQLAAL